MHDGHFFVIGAMKAGTSSLYKHLAAHPSIYAAPRKEPRFFANPAPTPAERDAYFQLFSGRRGEAWAFEASTAYTKHPMIPGVAQRIAATFPDARFIYLLRDPVDRICSAYLHNRAHGRERRPFEDAVWESEEYLSVSRYYLQLSQYLQVFPRDRVLVLLFEEFVANVDATLAQVARFLELETGFQAAGMARHENETSRKRAPLKGWLGRVMDHENLPWRVRQLLSRPLTRPLPSTRDLVDAPLRGRIIAELEDDLDQIQRLLGRRLTCWNLSTGYAPLEASSARSNS